MLPTLISAPSRTTSRFVEGQLELRGYVVWVLGIAVSIHRVLPTANELPPATRDQLCLVYTPAEPTEARH
jgi:hypothetical protein